MKSLDDFNKEKFNKGNNKYKILHSSNEPVKNGIACPECKNELWDSNPLGILTSNPPQLRVHCDCGFKGYRLM